MSDLPAGALQRNRPNLYETLFAWYLLILAAAAFLSLCLSHGMHQHGVFIGSDDFFMDFFNVLKYIAGRDPYHNTFNGMYEKAYPPLAYLLLYPFSMVWNYVTGAPKDARVTQLGLMSVVLFLVVCTCLLLMLLWKMRTGSDRTRFFTTAALLCSGIMLFSLERANIIFIAVVCVAFFLLYKDSENRTLRELALVALAVAAGIKVYPAIFGLLLLYEQRYRETCRLILYGMAAFLLPFLFFTGGVGNIPQLISNMGKNTETYLMRDVYYRFGPEPLCLLLKMGRPSVQLVSWLAYIPAALAALTAFRLDRSWKTILLLTCALVATPANSAYYCGLYLFPAVVLFLNDRKHRWSDWLVFVALILILNPFQIEIHGQSRTTLFANVALLATYLWLLVQACAATVRAAFGKREAARRQGSALRAANTESDW